MVRSGGLKSGVCLKKEVFEKDIDQRNLGFEAFWTANTGHANHHARPPHLKIPNRRQNSHDEEHDEKERSEVFSENSYQGQPRFFLTS